MLLTSYFLDSSFKYFLLNSIIDDTVFLISYPPVFLSRHIEMQSVLFLTLEVRAFVSLLLKSSVIWTKKKKFVK